MSWLLSDDLTRWEQGLLYRWGSGKPGHPEPAAAPGFAIKMKVSSLNIIRKHNARLKQGLLYRWGSGRSPAALSPQHPLMLRLFFDDATR